MAIDYDFKQTDSAKQPGYESNLASNRVPTMVFDGSDVMASADLWRVLTDKQQYTIYVVVEGGGNTSSPYILNVTNGPNQLFLRYLDNNGNLLLRQNNAIGTVGDIQFNLVPGGGVLDKKVFCIRNYGYFDGVDSGRRLTLTPRGRQKRTPLSIAE